MTGGINVSDLPNLPLAGVVVLDFGQVYQGPYATLLMAQAGADILIPHMGLTTKGTIGASTAPEDRCCRPP